MGLTDYKYKYNKYKGKYLQLNYGGDKRPKIIFLSGISGSGKTTLGKEIAQKLNGKFIDQDWFFKREKPMIKLSNGKLLRNWDTQEAIDITRLNKRLREEIQNKHLNYIILGGFALRDEWFDNDVKPDLHFHIKIPKELSLQTRLKLKPGNEKDQTLMFNEAVWVFYQETINKSKIDYFINGTINNTLERRSKQDMIDEIIDKIKKHNK